MTGVETDPSLLPDTPPPSQNNPVADVGAAEPAEGMPSAEPEATAPGVAGEQGSGPYPFTQGVDDGRPRTTRAQSILNQTKLAARRNDAANSAEAE